MKKLLMILLATAGVAAQPAVARFANLGGLWRGLAEAAPVQGGGGGQAPGQIRPRPAEGRDPEFKPPTIREYKPKSQLVTPQHPVPRAKYPVIDIHSHQRTPISPDEYDRVMNGMEANNLQILVNLSGSYGDQLRRGVDALKASKYKGRMVLFANINFGGSVGPGFGASAAKQLDDDIKAGAMGLKIFKDLGMFVRKANGERLPVDDPELDAVWETCARNNVPVLIHIAEPPAFFDPLDYTNERWLELALYSDRRHQTGVRFEELMAERDSLFAHNPKTTFVIAHLGWHAQDLGRLGRMFDRYPNLYSEVGAVLYDLGRQPRTAHNFLVKYQDRVLFGKDSFQPDEYPYYWRVFETEDEYFDYYRDYHAFWKLYGLGLPDSVLKKLYYGNAMKIIPGLPKDRLPK